MTGGETREKTIDALFDGLGEFAGSGSELIRGLTADSREVEPGFVFAALAGANTDGAHYIANALKAGASAVLTKPGVTLPADANAIQIESEAPRRALALAAARFYARQPRTIAAVTGTNGKTSVATFLRQIWTSLGLRSASLGTLGAIGPDGTRLDTGAPLTTPDPVGLQRLLADLADQGFDHVALEASSHGLDQYRLDGARVAAAGFTNLSRDHLDYHGTEEKYLAAKLRLFREVLLPTGIAVANSDTQMAEPVAQAAEAAGHSVWRVGEAGDRLKLVAAKPTATGQTLTIEAGGTTFEVAVPLAGSFQASNVLVAAGLAIACGANESEVISALSELEGAPGRMELIGQTKAGAAVYVDYAHTPDALETVLCALRPHTQARLHVVFGCGGDRDHGKRPQMGSVAVKHADRIVVTDDNPRSENPDAIRRAILAGVNGFDATLEIADRRAAIDEGIAGSAPGDTILIAGKGHETGQIVGDTVLPFDDRAVVREILAGQPAGGGAHG